MLKIHFPYHFVKTLISLFFLFIGIVASADDTALLKPVIINDNHISILYFNQPQPEYIKKAPGNINLAKFSLQFDKNIDFGVGEPIKFIISDAIVKCQNNTLDLIRDLYFDEKSKLLNEKSYQLNQNKKIWVGQSNLINQEINDNIIKYSCRDKSLDVPQLLLDCESDSKKDIYRFRVDLNSGGIIMNDSRHLLNPTISDSTFGGRLSSSKNNYFLKISRINGRIAITDSDNQISFSGECKKSTGNKF
jgi:hypothetical protein